MKLDLPDMLDFLEELVNIDSGTFDAIGVNHVAYNIIERYKTLNFTVETFAGGLSQNKPLGNHHLLKHKDSKDPQILILAHLDTVFENGTAKARPFTIKDNKAYGPGVIDMKASHVLVFYAIKTLINSGNNAYKDIAILLNSDEEIGSLSSKELIQSQAKNKAFALVMEPARANGNIVSARRGVGKYHLKITGIAAHSGIAPKDGASAINEIALKIIKLHELSSHDEGISVNVGLVKGGSSVNTVAPFAEAEIDLRLLTIEQGLETDQKIRQICQYPEDKRCEIELEGGINRPPMVKTPDSEFLIQVVKKHADSLNIKLTDILTGGGSDASFTSHVGTPTLDGLGPVGGYQHTKDEYLDITSLIPRTELFVKTLISLSETLR